MILKLLPDKRSEQTARFESTPHWTPRARLLGILAGWTLFGMGLAYVITMVAGFVAAGKSDGSIKDPHLARDARPRGCAIGARRVATVRPRSV